MRRIFINRGYQAGIHIVSLFFLAFVLVSCGAGKGRFKIEGHFLNMNQGEFYVYSPDGAIAGMDTIKVEGGRFSYAMQCEQRGTLMLVFPNFSEQPIFAQPGKSVDVSADASHIKEMKVEGTKENELMNSFRQQILSASPQEMQKAARLFIEDNPKSIVSNYLVRKYFIETGNYDDGLLLLKQLMAAQPDNGYLVRMQKQASIYARTAVGKPLPSFSLTDPRGRTITSSELAKAPEAVIYTWASWSYNSLDMQRQLKRAQRQRGGSLRLMGICLDADHTTYDNTMRFDSIAWPNLRDGRMFASPIMTTLGLMSCPAYIIVRNGRVAVKGTDTNRLKQLLNLQ